MRTEPELPKPTRYAVPTVALSPSLERDRLLRPAEAAAMLRVSTATLYRLVKAGKLPPPRRLTHRVSGWPHSVIRDLIHGDGTEAAAS
jgi:predicted DNA-binding transcriptional regulator AlpA